MILWEDNYTEPEAFIIVTHTAKGGGGGGGERDSRVKTIYTVTSLLKELPYLDRPVLNPLPWQRAKYERWARVRSVSGWTSSSRADQHHGGTATGQAVSPMDRAWSALQDPSARASPGEMVRSADVVCPSIDSIIRHYTELDRGGFSTTSSR
ncbi:hypothetical protein RRG08_047978 [Elysia crispata]|uniref:Uncharacterized protein n=1 Tax=Elysia crispata TaxID=231223 RepID=A0AAE0ZUJ9_9GAST|nr:hypothetical protein RRG08_047978 [Elysia crispata]